MPPNLRLTVLDGDMAIVQMASDAPWPEWLPTEGFVSVTRTDAELSIVCASESVPDGSIDGANVAETGWSMIRFEGPFAFDLTGILASVAGPLAAAGIGIFALSTFDTDYVLIKESNLDAAISTLRAAQHIVTVG